MHDFEGQCGNNQAMLEDLLCAQQVCRCSILQPHTPQEVSSSCSAEVQIHRCSTSGYEDFHVETELDEHVMNPYEFVDPQLEFQKAHALHKHLQNPVMVGP